MMKLNWKNQNKNNKRPHSSISRFPNLPFDLNDDDLNNPSTSSRQRPRAVDDEAELNPEQAQNDCARKTLASDDDGQTIELAEAFRAQGDNLAENGRYREALGKWEAALNLMPQRAVLHEQKSQVLLEIGDAWNALKAATRATELEPSWAEGWLTLGRAQLNFGEPASAIESFDRALAIKPDSAEVGVDRQTALNLVRKRKQLHSSGLSSANNRYVVKDKVESSSS